MPRAVPFALNLNLVTSSPKRYYEQENTLVGSICTYIHIHMYICIFVFVSTYWICYVLQYISRVYTYPINEYDAWPELYEHNITTLPIYTNCHTHTTIVYVLRKVYTSINTYVCMCCMCLFAYRRLPTICNAAHTSIHIAVFAICALCFIALYMYVCM